MAAAEPILIEPERVQRLLDLLPHARSRDEVRHYGCMFDLTGNKYVRLTDVIKQVQFLRDERAKLRSEDAGTVYYDAILLLIGGMQLS